MLSHYHFFFYSFSFLSFLPSGLCCLIFAIWSQGKLYFFFYLHQFTKRLLYIYRQNEVISQVQHEVNKYLTVISFDWNVPSGENNWIRLISIISYECNWISIDVYMHWFLMFLVYLCLFLQVFVVVEYTKVHNTFDDLIKFIWYEYNDRCV